MAVCGLREKPVGRLLINSVNWVGESGTSQPAGPVHQPTLTVWFEERPWVLRAVGETEAQV